MSSQDFGRSLRSLVAAPLSREDHKRAAPLRLAKAIWVFLAVANCGLLLYHGNFIRNANKLWIASLLPDKYTTGLTPDCVTPYYSRNSSALGPHSESLGTGESFQRLKSNEEFRFEYRQFAFEDAESLLAPSRGRVTCVPESFGYSMSESREIFPDRSYPRCSETHPVKYYSFQADFDQHWFQLQCKAEFNVSKYVSGPNGPFSFPEFIESGPFASAARNTGENVTLPPLHDFVLAKCQEKEEGTLGGFDIAYHRPIYNKRRHQEALKQSPAADKPIIVFLLVVDSFSRRHFFQKLPMTVEYLTGLQNSTNYAVFDLKLHNVMGDGSIHNTMPIFMRGELPPTATKRYANKLEKEPIWGDFKKKGFMTMLLFESCDQMFPDELGRLVSSDHLVRQFYCALMQFGNYSSKKEHVGEQRCVGPQMSHVYGFDYITAFSKMYKGAKQFIYAHFTAAHEASGTHAVTLDQDLRDFLSEYLESFRDIYEVVVMLQGDHGMRFGDWYNNMKAYQEHKLPAYFFLATRSLLDRVPNSYSALKHNSLKINSKKDVRRTLFTLMQYPNMRNVPQEDPSGTFYSVFSEAIPGNRSCFDANVPAWYCSCLKYEAIDMDWDGEISRIVELIADLTVYVMNSLVFTHERAELGHLCQRVEMKKIEEAYGVKANNFSETIKIVFSVGNKEDGRFTSTVLLSPQPIGYGIRRHQSERLYLDPVPYIYRGYKTYLSLITISRIDEFEGKCAKAARALGIKPDFCFCKDLSTVAVGDKDVAKATMNTID